MEWKRKPNKEDKEAARGLEASLPSRNPREALDSEQEWGRNNKQGFCVYYVGINDLFGISHALPVEVASTYCSSPLLQHQKKEKQKHQMAWLLAQRSWSKCLGKFNLILFVLGIGNPSFSLIFGEEIILHFPSSLHQNEAWWLTGSVFGLVLSSQLEF